MPISRPRTKEASGLLCTIAVFSWVRSRLPFGGIQHVVAAAKSAANALSGFGDSSGGGSGTGAGGMAAKRTKRASKKAATATDDGNNNEAAFTPSPSSAAAFARFAFGKKTTRTKKN